MTRPPYQGYFACVFTVAPFYHWRVWWSGTRWELNGRPLDIQHLSHWH